MQLLENQEIREVRDPSLPTHNHHDSNNNHHYIITNPINHRYPHPHYNPTHPSPHNDYPDTTTHQLVDEFFFELHFRCDALMRCAWGNKIPQRLIYPHPSPPHLHTHTHSPPPLPSLPQVNRIVQTHRTLLTSSQHNATQLTSPHLTSISLLLLSISSPFSSSTLTCSFSYLGLILTMQLIPSPRSPLPLRALIGRSTGGGSHGRPRPGFEELASGAGLPVPRT